MSFCKISLVSLHHWNIFKSNQHAAETFLQKANAFYPNLTIRSYVLSTSATGTAQIGHLKQKIKRTFQSKNLSALKRGLHTQNADLCSVVSVTQEMLQFAVKLDVNIPKLLANFFQNTKMFCR